MRAASTSLLRLAGAIAATLVVGLTQPAQATASHTTWSADVTRICAHALLFEGRHEIGTLAGAVAVARDIRRSTRQRLQRIRALEIVDPHPRLSNRWLDLERRLAAVYASSYVRIFEAIDAAKTPRQRARLPRTLGRLLHAPDAIRRRTQSLESRLHVPDCTGGGPAGGTSRSINP